MQLLEIRINYKLINIIYLTPVNDYFNEVIYHTDAITWNKNKLQIQVNQS